MLKFHPLTLMERADCAEDAVSLSFAVPPQLRDVYRFEAGQHIAVRMGDGERRTYSIVSPQGDATLRIGVRLQPDGRVSRFLTHRLAVGESLDVLTPNGSFHTRITPERAGRFIAFAAGSGITSVLSIASTVLAEEPLSRFMLFYGNRTAASTMFLEEVMALKNRWPDRFAAHFLMSREPQDIALLNGRIDGARVREFARVFFDPAAVDEFFICGPGSMNDDVAAALRELGATGRIHTEYFRVAAVPAAPAAPAAAPASVSAAAPAPTPELAAAGVAAGVGTRVTVLMDGRRRSFAMAAHDTRTVLDAAAEAGIELPFSCRAGVCSTCRARVLKGEVVMEQNHALEDWELAEGFVLCCQAHPTTTELELTYDE
ncbi:MAG TPA: 2Fe-2S iron-sulfur cluster-binding protein [Steroidobacteraceae bacterium]|nr:2Fe-2S iron-sulfur cluster-binding protein [Steroidobacteraceae bacterium]